VPTIFNGPAARRLRRDKGLTLRVLGNRADVDQNAISAYERGAATPTLATASRLAAALEVRIEDLLKLDERGAA
jgi:transcriptional regulator with XRE-family HTH domain